MLIVIGVWRRLREELSHFFNRADRTLLGFECCASLYLRPDIDARGGPNQNKALSQSNQPPGASPRFELLLHRIARTATQMFSLANRALKPLCEPAAAPKLIALG